MIQKMVGKFTPSELTAEMIYVLVPGQIDHCMPYLLRGYFTIAKVRGQS
jgi:hypothetical protein